MTKKSNIYDIERGLEWVDNVNRGGYLSVNTVDVPTNYKIDYGYLVELYYGEELKFAGVLMEKKIVPDKTNFKAIDFTAILGRRYLYNDDPDLAEASAELTRLFDGNVTFINDIVLDADTFLTPSQTSNYWQCDYDNIEGFISDMAMKCQSIDGSSYGFVWWIDTDGYLHFEPQGSGRTWTDLTMLNISIDGDINSMVNDLYLRGKEGYLIPQDKDSWTETTLNGWTHSTVGSATVTLDDTRAQTGLQSLLFMTSSGYGGDSLWRDIKDGGEPINMEKLSLFYFDYYSAYSGAPPVSSYIRVYDSASNYKQFDFDLTSVGWKSASLTKTTGWSSSSGTLDWTDISYMEWNLNAAGAGYYVNLDSLYFEIDEQVSNNTDTTSINTYGAWGNVINRPSLNDSSELDELAANFVEFYKNPSERVSFSIPYYVPIQRNDRVAFTFEGVDYDMPVTSIQHYVNQDKSESMTVYLGYKKMGLDDLIRDIRTEVINANAEKQKVTIIKG